MSAASQIRMNGFKLLLAHNGEELTYGAAASKVVAVVNRKVVNLRNRIANRDGKLDFSVMGMSEIEILMSAMTEPVSGENFKDSLGFRHRIRHVCFSDITWVVYCTQSRLP